MTAAAEPQARIALLNEIHAEFAAGDPHATVRRVCETFWFLRRQMTGPEWAHFRRCGVSQHPVRNVLRQHLSLTETFCNRRKQVSQELNAIRQEKQSPAILALECIPLIDLDQRFDFVYAATLFDRLDRPAAMRLLPQLIGILQPGGRLLVTNVAPGVREAAYLEACWTKAPQYRSEEHMAALTALIPEKQIASQYVYRDEAAGTVFLEIQRAAQ